LESAVTRLLPKEFHDHKQPYYKWLRDNGVRKGQEGANLHKLPDDMLESYNTMDAILTLMLYQRITDEFAGKYDWTYDHKLHMAACERIVRAKARGIQVNRQHLEGHAASVRAETMSIESDFLDKYQREIYYIEMGRWESWVQAPKTERGKQQRAAKLMPEDLKFNPGSTKQLAELFIDRLNEKPIFFTKEGKASRKARETDPDKAPFVPQPSMRASHLPSYGEGGQMLSALKKRRLVLLQEEKLLELSAKDGWFHHDLKACGTKTGRYSGGGGLNIQGLARKEKGLMCAMIPRPGNAFVSIDLAAGEPTVVAHYSQDKLYRAAAFDMVGKLPYLDGDLLVIDDPYLMFASISPIGKEAVRQAIADGLRENWLTHAEQYKQLLKKTRAFHKTVFLAKMYGQGARGTVNFAADQGEHLDFQTSKTLHHQFWFELFPNVRMLGERLEVQFKRQGYLLNEFGFRMTPERESLALNYTIQSSVSGIIKLFDEFVLEEAPWATWVTVIHDEQIWEVSAERVEEFRLCVQRATKRLNDFLGWTVEIRTGFAPGNNLYEAK
jgi:DNA polymerase I-like protein with 3'-5' exonuclease and polymerase domains